MKRIKKSISHYFSFLDIGLNEPNNIGLCYYSGEFICEADKNKKFEELPESVRQEIEFKLAGIVSEITLKKIKCKLFGNGNKVKRKAGYIIKKNDGWFLKLYRPKQVELFYISCERVKKKDFYTELIILSLNNEMPNLRSSAIIVNPDILLESAIKGLLDIS